jgi:hypothetical protein
MRDHLITHGSGGVRMRELELMEDTKKIGTIEQKGNMAWESSRMVVAKGRNTEETLGIKKDGKVTGRRTSEVVSGSVRICPAMVVVEIQETTKIGKWKHSTKEAAIM